jgi:hypothetical protein
VVAVGMLLACCVAPAGCQPQLDPQEYGDVSDKLPKIEGADEPYPLPKLEDPAEKPQESPAQHDKGSDP